ncbi:MAG: hypothetical protein LH660_19920, partial [Phormidesmis sp. CAN_BIN36]|nr:hypothetical protein [Phormidesmis sp. CAN_BIN36]
MDLTTKRVIGSVWHPRHLTRTTLKQRRAALSQDDRDRLRSLQTMTEFHQKKDQGRSVDPPVDAVYEALSGSTDENPKKAIPPAQESNPEAASSSVELPYERLQQGPITYFRYYFESVEQPTYLPSSTPELPTNKRNMLPLYLAGGGVLGAALISGFVIAGLANNSKAPNQKGTIDSKVKQTP